MDNESKDCLEEGEILEYEPIPRPSAASTRVHRGVVAKGDSDTSDTDDGVVCKRPRFQTSDSKKKSKYNVWASEFEASELIDGLCNWDARLKNTAMDRSRDVESYYCPEFDVSKQSEENNCRKRRFNEKIDLRSKLSRKNSKDEANSLNQPRYLTELRVTPEDSVEDVAHDIMNKLCEDNEDLIVRAVSTLGTKKTIDLFKKTKSLEEEGGMLVINQSRRRTPGGVFIQLIKRDIDVSQQQIQQIFSEQCKVSSKKEKRKHKGQIERVANNSSAKELPQLMTRKDLAVTLANSNVEQIDCENDSEGDVKENDCESDVKNPPPSPATVGESLDERHLSENDCGVKENDHESNVKNPPPSPATQEERVLSVYDDIFEFDIDNEMEFA